jgi:hypothetical protein
LTANYLGSQIGPTAHGSGNGPTFPMPGSARSSGVEPAENVATNITTGTTNIRIRLFMLPPLVASCVRDFCTARQYKTNSGTCPKVIFKKI